MSELIAKASRLAELLYQSKGYHTWNHALHVFDRCIEFANRLRPYGIKVDLTVVKLAAIFHDALYPLPAGEFFVRDHGQLRPSANKEETSAELARCYLERLQAPTELVNAVVLTIMGTNPLTPLETIEQMVLAAADLDIACDYAQFHSQSELLRQEAAQLSGVSSIHPKNFYRGSVNFLSLFLQRRIQLTPGYFTSSGQSQFHLSAVCNIVGNVRQVWKNPRIVGEIGCGQHPIILDPSHHLDETALYVGIDSDVKALSCAMLQAKGHYTAHRLASPMMLTIPAEERALSLPDQLLDELHVRNTWLRHLSRNTQFAFSELGRVLKPNGHLDVVEEYEPEGSASDTRTSRDHRRRLVERLAPHGLSVSTELDVAGGWGLRFALQ